MGRVRVGLPRLWTNPAASADQERFIHSPARIAIAATATKVGKTLGCSIWAVERLSERKKVRGWWIAPYRKTARIGYDRIVSLLPPGKFETNETDLRIELSNGSFIECRSGEKPDALYGEAIDFLIVDEGGRLREKAWTACTTTMLQTQGPIRVASNTDKGRRQWLYREFQRGMLNPSLQQLSYHIRATEAPHFMPGGIPGPRALQNFRATHTATECLALLDAEFPEDASTIFPGLRRCFVESWNGVPFPDGPAFYLPIDEDDGPYVAGLDLGQRRSFTVITVIDMRSGLLVYYLPLRHVSWKEQIEAAQKVQRIYGCPFLVDSTPGSVGDPILERMQIAGIAAEGYEFTNRSKQWLVEKMALDIQNQELRIPARKNESTGDLDPLPLRLVGEMEALEKEITEGGLVKYHAPGKDENIDDDMIGEEEDYGKTDDSVFSLALANWLRQNAFGMGIEVGGPRHPERGGRERQGYLDRR